MATDLELKKTVLLVDDDRSLVTIVEYMLHKAGYSVRCAYTGRDVFTSLTERLPDLILLDIVLPDMNGLGVLRRLKDTPETSAIPVILLTGKREYHDVLLGYQHGGDYYLSKPFTATQLITSLQLLLGPEVQGTGAGSRPG